MVHLGLECIQATLHLVEQAVEAAPDLKIVLGQEILRIALSEKQVEQLRDTACRLPQYCEWMEPAALPSSVVQTPSSILGGLRIARGGSLVLHAPSYLKGLYKACANLARQKNIRIEWKTSSQNLVDTVEWGDYDTVVLAAGAGVLQNLWPACDLPIQLVRGQSVELTATTTSPLPLALLCGKYVSPLPGDRILVGATHEFQAEPWSADEVKTALLEKTCPFYTWKPTSVESVTEGFRVQSQRGPRGRRPILGKCDWPYHNKTFVFTGLSSRGILYHAYYGQALVDEILTGKPSSLLTLDDVNWWRS